MSEYMTTQQVAELTGIPPATLRYYRHADIGPASFRLGGRRVVYRREEVLRWVAEQEKATRRGGGAA
jgi:DNA-binding transcriptional MerR regulator